MVCACIVRGRGMCVHCEGAWYVYNTSVQYIQAYLALPVHSNDTIRGVVDSGHKDGLSTDPVHIDTGASL